MKYLKVFTDFLQDMEPLSFDERGRLFTAMLVYMDSGTELGLIGNERFLWNSAKKWMEKQREAYTELCERNKRNITARYDSLPNDTTGYDSLPNDTTGMKNKTKNKTNKEILSNESTKKVPVSRNPPTVEEVKAYCADAGISIDAESFLDYYKSTGWKTSGGTPLYDWMSAARNWARRDRRSFKPPDKNYTPSAYRNADLERLEVDLNARP